MTKPTQAQIEAAEAFVRALDSDPHKPWHRDMATVDWRDTRIYNVDGEFNIDDVLSSVITAAAEVGENGLLARIKELENGLHEYACTGTDQPCGCYELYMKDKNIAAATIERCAQVAESRMRNEPASIINSMCEEIAAGIRALKDKP